jgi:capsule polysaccharide export protein KpsE/RkpR
MTYSSAAPVRQPGPTLPDKETLKPPEQTETSDEKSLASLWLIWAHRRFLLRLVWYALIASTVVAFLIPARYQSTTRLMPPDNQSASGLATALAAMSGGSGGALSGIAGDFLGLAGKNTSELFVGILESRTAQDKLIQQFELQKLYGDRRMTDARKDLADHTSISVDRKTQIITIDVTDRDAKRAAAMGDAYIAELNRLVAELSTSSARRERIFLEERLQAVNRDLELAEKEFSQFSSKNTAIDIKEQGKAMLEAAATLQGELIAAQSELEGLRQIYSDNNVRVRSVRARIAELRGQLEKIGGKGEEESSTSGQEQESLYPSIRKLPLLGVSYADLYRRTKVQEAVFETLTKEYELAKVQEAKEIPTVKVLDPPNIPDKRSFPPRFLVIFMGTSVACAMGIAWVLTKSAWEVADPADPRKIFAQEVFTTVRARVPDFARNGSGKRSAGEHFNSWISLHREKDTKLR